MINKNESNMTDKKKYPIYPDYSDNPFRDSRGRFLTQNIFFETTKQSDHSRTLYTLKPYDHVYNGVTYPSLKKIYMELADPTEYRIATEYLGGWRHWNRLLGDKRIKKEIESWREELEVKLRAEAIEEIRKDAKSESKSSVSSAKWLADRGWNKRKPGQPSNEEKQRIEKQIEEKHTEYDEDYKRVFGDELEVK